MDNAPASALAPPGLCRSQGRRFQRRRLWGQLGLSLNPALLLLLHGAWGTLLPAPSGLCRGVPKAEAGLKVEEASVREAQWGS